MRAVYNLPNADGRIQVWRSLQLLRSAGRPMGRGESDGMGWRESDGMEWGGFTLNHRTQLHVFRRVNAAVYQTVVINNHVCTYCSKTMPGLTRPGQHRHCWLSTTSQRWRGRPYHRTWHLSNTTGMKSDIACRLADFMRTSRRWRQHWCINGRHSLRHCSNSL